MTTFHEIEVRCAVCGELQRVAELTSTSCFGAPDLDLRPSGPQRWALQFTVQRCASCGYCSQSLGRVTAGAADVVSSAVYRDVLERSRLPRLARSLFCSALVLEAAGDPNGAGWRFLEAAWACDDVPEPGQARICRERAIEMFRRSLETGDAGASTGVVLTLVADLLRRARRFGEAEDVAEEATGALAELPDDDDTAATADIARYIATLASVGDDAAHCCDEAFTAEQP
jgi:hypothetical protein